MTSKMGKMLQPPAPISVEPDDRVLFLAGSIDLGVTEDWQCNLAESLADIPRLLILNPRRDQWEGIWDLSSDDPKFRGQVEWELDGLEAADVIAYHFAPGSQAPVTMCELGLYARSGKAVVCCPNGFWRKGNVDIVCTRYGIEQVNGLDELATAIRRRLSE